MFLPKQLLELEALLPVALPPTVRRFLARRPQGTVLGNFRGYPRALVLAQYRERIFHGQDALLLAIGRNGSQELLVHLKDECVYGSGNGELTLLSTSFNDWIATQRNETRKVNDKKLLRAARAGDIPRMRRLLQRGADVDERDAAGNTPLMAALLAWQYEAAALLLDHAPDLSLRDAEGHSALMWAAYRNQPALVQRMIALGADMQARTHSGEDLLYFARSGPRSVTEGGGAGSEEVVEILLAAGLKQQH